MMGKRKLCLSSMLVFSFVLVISAKSQHVSIEWQTDYYTAVATAKESGKPIMMHFYHKFGPRPKNAKEHEIFKSPDVIGFSKKFICLEISVEESGGLADRYNIKSIDLEEKAQQLEKSWRLMKGAWPASITIEIDQPPIIFTDPWGNEINRVEPTETVALLRTMDSVPADFKAVSKWYAILDYDAHNLEALFRIADFYHENQYWQLSNDHYESALTSETAKNYPKIQEQILEKIGLNYLKMNRYHEAHQSFKKCAEKFPNGSRFDYILLGMITTEIKMGDLDQARQTFKTLQSGYPNSPATEQAERNLQIVAKN